MTELSKKKLNLTTADLIVLGLICERPMHGYELNQELQKRDVRDWADVSRPQVYYSLKKLAGIHMITATSSKLPTEGPERQVYRITTLGKKSLNKALDDESWTNQRPPPPFITWLALSIHASDDVIKRHIIKRREYLEMELAREVRTYQTFSHLSGKPIATGLLMIEFAIRHFKTELKWLEKVETTLLN